jgi:cytochrome bd ubiquinol oxidase subunit II
MTVFLWLTVMLVAALMYVVLDGYDLGLGVASLLEPNPVHRRRLLESVAVGWDGNETWLILLGVGVWAGFPLAFGTVLPHLYLVLIIMLFALIVRGVSVEMASQRAPAAAWVRAFGVASLVATFAQGMALGGLATDVAIRGDAWSGTALESFTWFSVLTGCAYTALCTALGYAYAWLKTVGELQVTAARRGLVAVLVAGVLVAVALAAMRGTAAPLNLSTPGREAAFIGLLLFAVSGLLTAAATIRRTGGSGPVEWLAFAGLAVFTIATALAVVVGRYPVLAPPDLTLAKAVAPDRTMTFVAVGIGLNMPLVLFYNLFAHRAFRGKLDLEPRTADAPTVHGAST